MTTDIANEDVGLLLGEDWRSPLEFSFATPGGTDIVDALEPHASDLVMYKHRFSGFYETDLDATLKRGGIKHLIVTGCTTSVCVETTVRDASFRDYQCVSLSDCMSEPIGNDAPTSNHDASTETASMMKKGEWVAFTC